MALSRKLRALRQAAAVHAVDWARGTNILRANGVDVDVDKEALKALAEFVELNGCESVTFFGIYVRIFKWVVN